VLGRGSLHRRAADDRARSTFPSNSCTGNFDGDPVRLYSAIATDGTLSGSRGQPAMPPQAWRSQVEAARGIGKAGAHGRRQMVCAAKRLLLPPEPLRNASVQMPPEPGEQKMKARNADRLRKLATDCVRAAQRSEDLDAAATLLQVASSLTAMANGKKPSDTISVSDSASH
jgi:hypothetical protein